MAREPEPLPDDTAELLKVLIQEIRTARKDLVRELQEIRTRLPDPRHQSSYRST
jgi:predicted lipoprotein